MSNASAFYLQVLPSADWIIVLRDGGIQAQGTLADLQAKGVNFGDVCDEEDDKSETYDENPSESVVSCLPDTEKSNAGAENAVKGLFVVVVLGGGAWRLSS